MTPSGPYRCDRRYLPGTNILESRFETGEGVAVVTDLMPIESEEGTSRRMVPEHEVLRTVRCEEGSIDLEMIYEPRPDYGRTVPRIRETGVLGFRSEMGGDLLTLRTDLPARIAGPGRIQASTLLRKGQAVHASLTLARQWPGVLRPLQEGSRDAIRRSMDAWRGWSRRLTYDGPYREAVLRSALTLKLLVHAPSGAIIAAPTTSLPERPGGDLNWDYRFSWLRDSSLTVSALFGLGFEEEALAFSHWLVHSTALTRPELKILYDVFGRKPYRERILHDLRGFAQSRPVRIGNAARDQLQLDVYGEVLDTLTQCVEKGGSLDRVTQRMVLDLGRYVSRNWRRPDEGIWEPRSGRRRHTHSRLLCWTALDRLIKLSRAQHLRSSFIPDFERERTLIRQEIEDGAWNPRIQSYVSEIGGEEVDASLLLIPWYGFEDAASARMQATFLRIEERLGAGRSLLYRYRTADSPGEGTFGICSFWAVEHLALAGRLKEAQARFEELLAFSNDVGLYGEEIDPGSGAALGNFPQAFTHVGLINAALTIERQRKGERHGKRELPPCKKGPVESRKHV